MLRNNSDASTNNVQCSEASQGNLDRFFKQSIFIAILCKQCNVQGPVKGICVGYAEVYFHINFTQFVFNSIQLYSLRSLYGFCSVSVSFPQFVSRGLSEEFGLVKEAEEQLLLYNIFISHQLASLQVFSLSASGLRFFVNGLKFDSYKVENEHKSFKLRVDTGSGTET